MATLTWPFFYFVFSATLSAEVGQRLSYPDLFSISFLCRRLSGQRFPHTRGVEIHQAPQFYVWNLAFPLPLAQPPH